MFQFVKPTTKPAGRTPVDNEWELLDSQEFIFSLTMASPFGEEQGIKNSRIPHYQRLAEQGKDLFGTGQDETKEERKNRILYGGFSELSKEPVRKHYERMRAAKKGK
jgi:hypothetical protein